MPDVIIPLTLAQVTRAWNAYKTVPLRDGTAPPPDTATAAEKLVWVRRHAAQALRLGIRALEVAQPDAELDSIT